MSKIAALVGALSLTVLVACGGAPSLPDPGPCPTPATVLSPSATARRGQANPYFTALQESLNRLQDLYTTFRLAHANNRFGADEGFRPAVARFIDESTCVALSMRRVEAPNPAFQALKQQIDAALDDYVAHLQSGRAAVRSRNVTEYHAFWDGLEARFDAVRASFSRR